MARHQVILIGRRMDTALVGVKEFHPQALHLLYTESTSDSFKPFVAMLPEGTSVDETRIDPYDMASIKEVCRAIKASLAPDDILQYNVTEGTKVAAGAIVQYALSEGDSAVYYTQEGEMIDFVTGERRPTEARICNAEFVKLFGNHLTSYNMAKEMSSSDIATAWDVKRFTEQHQKYFQRIQHQYRSFYGGRIEKLPEEFDVEHIRGMHVVTRGGMLDIRERGKVLFHSENPLAVRLFFTGRWWEVIVSSIVYKWDLARHANVADSEVWRNVEFSGEKEGRTKNELDILVNDRRRLLLIECKSGYLGQENVYKLDSTRETYGGDHSKALLVSYYPLDPDLVQKCRDLHVYWYAPATDVERVSYIHNLPAWLDTIVNEIEPK